MSAELDTRSDCDRWNAGEPSAKLAAFHATVEAAERAAVGLPPLEEDTVSREYRNPNTATIDIIDGTPTVVLPDPALVSAKRDRWVLIGCCGILVGCLGAALGLFIAAASGVLGA